MTKKEEFEQIYLRFIEREGSTELLHWLYTTDFFEAPASTRFHGNYEGGLLEHSVNVFWQLYKQKETLNVTTETIAIVSLLHDLCKVNFYQKGFRNKKDESTGQWHKETCYTIDDTLPYGHGEKSVYLISQFMKLTEEEAMAINWHMGGFDDRVKGGSFALSKAMEKYPLLLELHIADMRATYIDEKKGEN